MHNYHLFVSSGLKFNGSTEALHHIGAKMVSEGVVKDSWPAALLARESSFPTGIALDGHAVAIPHCEAVHAIKPAIYVIRPAEPVLFAQADDDGHIPAELIIALIVTHPQEQLQLLKALFRQLQQADFIEALLEIPEKQIVDFFKSRILSPAI